MKTIVTLVVNPEKQSLTNGDIARISNLLGEVGLGMTKIQWLSPGEAVDIYCSGSLDRDSQKALMGAMSLEGIDLFYQEEASRNKSLFLADMDSTIIGQECIDEIADLVGLREKVTKITEAAMHGEIDFDTALVDRVALLKGLPVSNLNQIWENHIHFNDGAKTLIPTLKSKGIKTILVSGGFTWFTEKVQDTLGFDETAANVLGISDDTLTGQVEGQIVTGDVKREKLLTTAKAMNLSKESIMSVGDGANDIPMLEAAGLGIAYHAKPKTIDAADASLDHTCLTSLLFALGIPREDFISVD